MRRILCLPNRTHRELLPLIVEQMPVEVSLHCRMIKFFRNLNKSNNLIVKYIANYAVSSAFSTLGMNVRLVTNKLNISPNELLNFSEEKLKRMCLSEWFNTVSEANKAHASVIRERIDQKESGGSNFFDSEFCDHII